jgi:hypothetical protein
LHCWNRREQVRLAKSASLQENDKVPQILTLLVSLSGRDPDLICVIVPMNMKMQRLHASYLRLARFRKLLSVVVLPTTPVQLNSEELVSFHEI